jgi:E3 ubiquitin ligase
MLVVLLVLASFTCLLLGVRYLRQALAVTGTAASYIRSAAQGYVVLVGEGIPLSGRPLVAPFSGKPCLWWSTQVEMMLGGVGDERIAPSGDAFNKHFSKGQFLLRDGSGACLVDPDSADVQVKSRDVWYGSSMSGGSVAQGNRTRGVTDDLRFVEERIELHQRIVARGYFRTAHADPGATTRPASYSTVTPGTNVLCQPPDGRHFLISTISEEVLARNLRLRAAVALLSCAMLAGWALLAGRAG